LRLSVFRKLLALLLIAPLSGIAQNLPDLGDVADASLSESQERVFGKRIMQEVRSDRAYVEDAELNDYINALGNRLVQSADSGPRQFEFFLLKDDSINAFALYGGFIGVHTATVTTSQSESELASVLGHEISHVLQRHIARQIAGQKGAAIASLAALAVAILAARGNSSSQAPEAALATASALNIQSQLDYTREHESEADRTGLTLLQRAGFDVRGMVSFFERLWRANRHNDSKAPGYLRTHPLTTERIADLQNRVDSIPARHVADSVDYQFAHAKLAALAGSPTEAVDLFRNLIAEKTVRRTRADAYGLALALKRSREFAAAEKDLASIRSVPSLNAWIELLAAEIKRDKKQFTEALSITRTALKTFPDSRALFYSQIATLYDLGQIDAALAALTERLRNIQDDPALYTLQARGYSLKRKNLAMHRATAEAYYLRGNLTGAVEQLDLAVKAKDGDFYEQSGAEARLRQLKAEHERAKKDEKKER
jgi:predicted Zn-dependent protease